MKVYSPNVAGIEVVQRKERRARRARLYYMRYVHFLTRFHEKGPRSSRGSSVLIQTVTQETQTRSWQYTERGDAVSTDEIIDQERERGGQGCRYWKEGEQEEVSDCALGHKSPFIILQDLHIWYCASCGMYHNQRIIQSKNTHSYKL